MNITRDTSSPDRQHNSTYGVDTPATPAFFGWSVLIGTSLLVALFVLVPYWWTGGYYPFTQPGWYPDRPDELQSISQFRGTIWEKNRFLSDLFWQLGCMGWYLWIPAMLFVIIRIETDWHLLRKWSRWKRILGVVVLVAFGVLWFITAWKLFVASLD